MQYPSRKCLECAQRFEPKAENAKFCAQACKQIANNRAKAEGAAVIQLAKAWRGKRGSGPTAKQAFQELCAILDEFNARDRAAGRAPAAEHVSFETRYFDRERPTRRREALDRHTGQSSPATDPDQEDLFPLPAAPR